MKVSKLQLVNFRGARNLTLEFSSQLTLLVGVNGAGKSTILDSLAIMLSWAAARLRSPNSNGRRIIETDIHNEESFSMIQIHFEDDCPHLGSSRNFYNLTQVKKGRKPKEIRNENNFEERALGAIQFGFFPTTLTAINNWASDYREHIEICKEEYNLPLFVYYPVNRSFLDIPLKIRKTHQFDLLEAHDNALTSGTNFRLFFEWYRNREDLENETFRESGNLIEDPQLKAVRHIISHFLPGFSKISIKRNPLHMQVIKNGKAYHLDQMSDGEKCLFAMVGDLARRLAIANPTRENPLEGEGVVLIDEIDLHLHPSWQRMVISKLTETFPNCQFIVSTHSPQVFGEVKAESIRCLSVDSKNGLETDIPPQAFGLDSAKILDEMMESKSRNQEITDKLDEIFMLIDQDEFTKAKEKIKELKQITRGSIPELVRAETVLTMLEPEEGIKE
jgi:predicted ATP-binding protein involved in virulence